MKYSLVNVQKTHEDGRVDGVWLQHYTGTFESAVEWAKATEQANSNRISVAVVPELSFSSPNYNLQTGLTRLDERR